MLYLSIWYFWELYAKVKEEYNPDWVQGVITLSLLE
jgi:hypothetical protein